MKSSVRLKTYLKNEEGYRQFPYDDPGGHDAGDADTVGFGHLILPGEDFSNGLTIAQAEALLEKDLIQFEDAVNQTMKVPLKQNQFDALVSYAWNIGAPRFRTSTLAKYINRRESEQKIRLWWVTHYITNNGVFLQGLLNRRNEEADMFFEGGDYQSAGVVNTSVPAVALLLIFFFIIWIVI